ncbi:S-locus receptor kinase (SRK) [Zostera marina]|uniref:Receptor-like serine/threonine-protein kinase n=1 Tax=Zostera marina TaxID=29655 RepID=A0A0K9PLW0_ZOSMR|nr:S-locus receptor kinase (SRK) [Zostera marina]
MRFVAILFALFILSHLFSSAHSLGDSIGENQILKDDDTLVSESGIFVLGFFYGNTTKKTRYLGLWYNFSTDVIVWVANRENPITKSFASLQLKENGNLDILQSQTSEMVNTTGQVDIVWSSDSSNIVGNTKSMNQTVAKLSDSGNLIVTNGGRQIWQSFDYPTDTYLPDNQKFFRFGPWNGAWFNGLNGMISTQRMYRYVDNETTTFYEYDDVAKDTYIRFTIFPNISISRMIWKVKEPYWVSDNGNIEEEDESDCGLYSKCGTNGICKSQVSNQCDCFHGFQPKSSNSRVSEDTLGCQREGKINCSDENVFLEINNLKIPDTTNSTIDKNMSLAECGVACKDNCSCVAYAPLYLIGFSPRGCIMWYGDLIDTISWNQGGQSLYLRSTNSRISNDDSKESNKKTTIIVAVSVGVFIILLSVGISLWIKTRSQRGISTSHNQNLKWKDEVSLFSITVISSATNNFSSDNKIGQGGFGSVYKGTMEDGMDVAVKRLSKCSGEGLDEFMNEVVVIAKLQHKNLVRLLGCCMEGDEKILVFEFMKNNSLDNIIFGENRHMLDWPKRVEIIKGITKGLLYLHQDSRIKVIHRDLKAANILLDDDMNPKITDFGTARLFDAGQMEGNTGRIIGTYGYMSPEYASRGNFSIKSDVFSFGVLLLEIISGKKNRVFYKHDSKFNLLEEAWIQYNDQKTIMLLDKCLISSSSISEVVRFIKIGLLCVQDLAIDRPTMYDVLMFMLINDTAIVQEPKRPIFCNGGKLKSSFGVLNSTFNDVTLTRIEGR